MPVDLAALVEPAHCALVTQECQGGVIGEQSALPQLAAVAAPIRPNLATLARAARAAGVPVIHNLAARRPDGLGANRNARLFHGVAKAPVKLTVGSPAAQVVPELGPDPTDFSITRLHGLGPMAGTDLDPILRNLGVTTIVGVGVSVNVGMTNFVMDAVNLGYQFVLPRDAVAGLPAAYAEAVIDNTLALLATITTSAEVIGCWEASEPGPIRKEV
ncbi:MAG: isochorismatase family protein [Actinobacteria bacterium]|nr:isochorismatase family protein [Actinomycetota bacterium]